MIIAAIYGTVIGSRGKPGRSVLFDVPRPNESTHAQSGAHAQSHLKRWASAMWSLRQPETKWKCACAKQCACAAHAQPLQKRFWGYKRRPFSENGQSASSLDARRFCIASLEFRDESRELDACVARKVSASLSLIRRLFTKTNSCDRVA